MRWVLAGGAPAVVLAIVGLPPISIHEPTHFLGIMGPSCGLTCERVPRTRRPRRCVALQPGSFVLAAMGGLIGARGVAGRVWGRRLEITFRRPLLFRVVVGVAVVLLWVNQQRHVALIR